MNKAEFASKLAENNSVPVKVMVDFVDSYHELVKQTLAKGEPVTFAGFGGFENRARPARTARNPRSGERIEIAAKSVPVFKPSKGLKDAVAKA